MEETELEGTADYWELENMIQLAKDLRGVTPYVYGGGHSDWDTQKDMSTPTGLDCSSLVCWALYNGMGIEFLFSESQDFALCPPSSTFSQYLDTVGTGVGGLQEAKRGDLVVTPGHIDIYLGYSEEHNTHLSMHALNEGVGLKIAPPGAGRDLTQARVLRIDYEGIINGDYPDISFDASRIKDSGIETDLDNFSDYEGGDDDERSEGSGEATGSLDYDPFIERSPVQNNTGLDQGDGTAQLSSDFSYYFNQIIMWFVNAVTVVVFILYGLFIGVLAAMIVLMAAHNHYFTGPLPKLILGQKAIDGFSERGIAGMFVPLLIRALVPTFLFAIALTGYINGFQAIIMEMLVNILP